MFILLASAAFWVTPVHAQVSVTLDWTVTTAAMGAVLRNEVTVTSVDGLPHTVTLSLAGADGSWNFAPNPLDVPAGGSATSTLAISLPGPNELCPGESSATAAPLRLTARAREGSTVLSSASLEVRFLPIGYPLAVKIEVSKPSYMVGETVSLLLSSSATAEGVLAIKKPDGTTWHRQVVTLPGTFMKIAAQPTGTYSVELEAYYCGRTPASASFSVTPDTYEVIVSLAGLPVDISTGLRVDGNKVPDMKGGDVRVLTYPIGTSHTFQVDQYVSAAMGYRYYCESNTWTARSEGSNTFNYATQVYLDVGTDPDAITGVTPSGWYAVGSSASITEVPAEVVGGEGTKYLFKEWTVDGVPREGNGFVIVTDAPHKVVAEFDTMFMLTVVSDYGNPTGAGYYKSGETAKFSVVSPVGIGIQYVFVEWTGDYVGKEPQGSTLMDGPKKVNAAWVTSYFQLYLIVGAVAALMVVAGFLLWRRSRARPSTIKPPPSPTSVPAEPVQAIPHATVSASDSRGPLKRAVSVSLRCTNCGHELKEGEPYCPECGQKQTD